MSLRVYGRGREPVRAHRPARAGSRRCGRFYDALLPALRFTETYHGGDWNVWATTDPLPGTAYFAITEEPGHVANANRIAFWDACAAEVDRVAEVARAAGAVDVSGPKAMPYGPGYYAVYFADPCGNRFEVYVRPETTA